MKGEYVRDSVLTEEFFNRTKDSVETNTGKKYNFNHRGVIESRCTSCGDSIKSETTSHREFSVIKDPDGKARLTWYCHRCSTGGRVTPDILLDLGVRLDDEFVAKLLASEVVSVAKVSGGKSRLTWVFPNSYDEKSKEYLEMRLGKPIPSPDKRKHLGLIVDPKVFVAENMPQLEFICKGKPKESMIRTLLSAYFIIVSPIGLIARINRAERFLKVGGIRIRQFSATLPYLFRKEDVRIALVEGLVDYLAVSLATREDFQYDGVICAGQNYRKPAEEMLRKLPHAKIEILANTEISHKAVMQVRHLREAVKVFANYGDESDYGVPEDRFRKIPVDFKYRRKEKIDAKF